MHEIREAKFYQHSILFDSGEKLVLVKDIERYEVMDAITALSLFPDYPLGDRILVEGDGHRFLRNTKAREPLHDFDLVEDVFHLIVTKKHNPRLLIARYETLKEIYRALSSDF